VAKCKQGIYQNKNGELYCKFQFHGKQYHKKCNGVTNKNDAYLMKCNFIHKLQQIENGVIPAEERNIKLSALTDMYVNNNKLANKQREPKEKVRAANEFFGKNCLANKIKPEQITKFMEWLKQEKKLSNSTINRYISFLSKSFNLGIDNRLIMINPCRNIRTLREPKETIKFYLREDEIHVLEAVKEQRKDFYPFVVCAFQTGLRCSNIQYLTWEQVNLDERNITIQPNDNKGHKVLRIHIDDNLLTVLNSLPQGSEYVFINPLTNRHYTAPDRILRKICEKANVKYIGFHGIRHTVGTRLMEQGTPINVIQAILGHTDIRTTMKYVHLTDDSIKEAMTKLNSG